MTANAVRVLRIRAGNVEALADLAASNTADAIWEALPFTVPANIWGDEIYFTIPVGLEQDQARATVQLGEIGYWPPGQAFCIFFGRTPASSGNEIRAASVVNPLGKLTEVPVEKLRAIRAGTRVAIEELKD